MDVGQKKRGADKTALATTDEQGALSKPTWIRAKAPISPEVGRLTGILRDLHLHTVCEEASCPNLGECFKRGTATFMIMGDVCTRRCPFCDVAHGRPAALDTEEPGHLADAIGAMKLKYVVITSVTRDDLEDGGAAHFAQCIESIRKKTEGVKVEILVPDFRGHVDAALKNLGNCLPDVFNHNLETVPRLYAESRPGARYHESLRLLQRFKETYPGIPTKSGLMLGLGETDEEILEVMRDLRVHGCDMLTIGQYLRPSRHHLPVQRYVTPEQFEAFRVAGLKMGFSQVASGPLVRSSYHADLQAKEVLHT
ncbi:lipoate synthase [Syntrophotalea carbinolica DSM 2380]|uniref:Lipoyl synthase n=1 Tax=Syntrophotalea carbinolica (strain DSM 2380 / NBRC 103641 / GraBd1) TaxID=338963 RepID=LIPA_SYNC1|nr:lipoyl synthase [Syntrophotalea carbinolica]Q57390.2 RecName: Full=Lipoyl synthase; AltName: Full=Lip-syn; Short=LS; AltName: Full=Lipoate synthase; AltName: Full=Lipoic acid synthase; AltName: Full=Sulfur insertion protein LipA [Syntrophotalea carbinolica DSM 2380]ABA87606.1 lipoate synthase [Syntrophotalea carbinolica DSM 2380]